MNKKGRIKVGKSRDSVGSSDEIIDEDNKFMGGRSGKKTKVRTRTRKN